uniref:Secreted ookinete protein n=1 Tax=Meloidogyne floridensis TaxID=298350 RepID=A0A915PGJ1_9BILA
MLINKLLLFINLIILFNLNATNDYSEDSDSSHMSEKVLSSEEYYEANNLNETSPDEDWMENESPSTSKPVNVKKKSLSRINEVMDPKGEGQIEKNKKRKRDDVELSKSVDRLRGIKQNLYERQRLLFGDAMSKREHYLNLAEEDEDLKDRKRRAKNEDIDKFEICFINE